ncbi:VOC family protein [Amycolatopsis sp. WGS_07]|uniref:VOC family protein n=1 Tax=Amycolatopsis sp. WGS_07 TaxID=3076764 RepID=UPI003873C3CB
MATTTSDVVRPAPLAGAIDHVGIQTMDLENAVAWYQEFLGGTVSWEMNDGFSALSRQRLPGLARVVEVAAGGIRLHLFTRTAGTHAPPASEANQFQHLCIRVGTAEQLRLWRLRWMQLYESGRYTFVRDEPATEIDIDAQGMQSFYAYDVNGLEVEFTYQPDAAEGRDSADGSD